MMSMWRPLVVSYRPHDEPFHANRSQDGWRTPHVAGLGDLRHVMTDTSVHVVDNAHLFGVQMNVSAYKPEEIDVKVHDENKDSAFLLVTGKHDEKPDEHKLGFVSRHFTRRYALPKDVDIKELHCNLSNKGILTLQAPRKHLTLTANNTRAIPITHVANAPMLGEMTPVEKKLAALKGN